MVLSIDVVEVIMGVLIIAYGLMLVYMVDFKESSDD